MRARNIVVGQLVERAKIARSRELRRQMTERERVLWQAIRDRQLDGLRFRRQQIIDGFIVDFYCHAARLVIEVDGPVHEQQVQYDRERDQALATRGLRVLRLTNEEVQQALPAVLQRIIAVARGNL